MMAPATALATGVLTASAVAAALAPRHIATASVRHRGAELAPPALVTRTHAAARAVGAALWVALGLGALLLVPPLGLAVLAAPWLRHRFVGASARRALERSVARALPDVVDLLLLCTSAGMSLALAHPMVAVRASVPLRDALTAAALAADAGAPRSDALVDALRPLGDAALRLGQLLADHLRYGVALVPGLERLGSELRLERQRRAEQDARRVPVRLLAPLLTCVLPAFALLTVVPLLAASLGALPT